MKMMNQGKKEKGFTLLELLIVIGIIAILAAAVVIAINPARHFQQARNSQRWNDINTLSSAVYSYLVDKGGFWPPCLATSTPTSTVDALACQADLVPDYITAIPRDPQNTTTTISGYQMHLTTDNRLRVFVSTTTPGLKDDVTGIELTR